MEGPEGSRFWKRKLPLQALLEGCCGCSVAGELGVAGTLPLQRRTNCVEVESSEDYRPLDCRGRVLLRVDSCRRGHLSQTPSHRHGPRLVWTPVYEDTTACIEWGYNVGGRERAKHIDIRKHFAHQVVQLRYLRLIKVNNKDQLADIFTKALPPLAHASCLSKILRRPWAPQDS